MKSIITRIKLLGFNYNAEITDEKFIKTILPDRIVSVFSIEWPAILINQETGLSGASWAKTRTRYAKDAFFLKNLLIFAKSFPLSFLRASICLQHYITNA